MIKRIELVNFMSHEHTVIEPDMGLTVLVGPNNCGKSAVVTALQILAYNDPSTYVLRHDTRECRIIVETSEGDVIQWSRGKNKPAGYKINGKAHDRLRGNVPDELVETLRLSKVNSDSSPIDVHFGQQKSPVFLLNDQPRVAAEFFASSSDAAHLMEMQNLHQQKVRDARREKTQLSGESHLLKKEIQALQPVDELLEQLAICQSEFDQLAIAEKRLASLQKTLEHLHAADFQIQWLTERFELLGDVPSPPAVTETHALHKITHEIKASANDVARFSSQSELFDSLDEPPRFEDEGPIAKCAEDIFGLQHRLDWHCRSAELISSLPAVPELENGDPIANAASKMNGLQLELASSQIALSELADQQHAIQSSIKSWADENPVCPTCGGQVDSSQILAGNRCSGHGQKPELPNPRELPDG